MPAGAGSRRGGCAPRSCPAPRRPSRRAPCRRCPRAGTARARTRGPRRPRPAPRRSPVPPRRVYTRAVRLRLALIVLAAVAGAAITVVLVSGNGGEGKAQPTPRLSIQGPQVRIGDLVYNVTAIRVLRLNKRGDAPYLTNYPPPPRGNAYLGVFLKFYNMNATRALPSAPGYLLEPIKNPGLVTGLQSSESPYALIPGAEVPAGGELPVPE